MTRTKARQAQVQAQVQAKAQPKQAARSATPPPAQVPTPLPPSALYLRLAIGKAGLVVTSPAGHDEHVTLDMAGLTRLRALAAWAARVQAEADARAALQARTDADHAAMVQYTSMTAAWARASDSLRLGALQPGQTLADLERVCHCGARVVPFMSRCEGCPGHSGAGKVPAGAVQVTHVPGRGKARARPPVLDATALAKLLGV